MIDDDPDDELDATGDLPEDDTPGDTPETHEDEPADAPVVDETVEEPGEERPEPEEPEPERQPSRREARVQQLANERRVEQERREAAERELAQVRQRQHYEAEQARQHQAYREWYQQLTPEQQWYEDQRQQQLAQNRKIDAALAHMNDQGDRASFRMFLSQNPQFSQYEDDVEKMLQMARQNGIQTSRDIVLNQVIGMKVRQMKAPVQKKQAQQRVQAQKVKPSHSAGDAPQKGGRKPAPGSLAAIESRLKGIVF